jgi:hypothetical protein
MKRTKYQAIKTKVDGIEFDSRKEARRYRELLLLQRAGEIQKLRTQEKFVLIPSQYETVETGEYYQLGSKKGIPKTKEVCVEKAVVYVADFTYMENGKLVVEDTKGFKTKDYIIKRKLMLKEYGIKIREV